MGFGFPKAEREAIVRSEPDKFMMPSKGDLRYHWLDVRLKAIDEAEMRELVLDAWRMAAPKRVVAEFERQEGGPGSPRRSTGRALRSAEARPVATAARTTSRFVSVCGMGAPTERASSRIRSRSLPTRSSRNATGVPSGSSYAGRLYRTNGAPAAPDAKTS